MNGSLNGFVSAHMNQSDQTKSMRSLRSVNVGTKKKKERLLLEVKPFFSPPF